MLYRKPIYTSLFFLFLLSFLLGSIVFYYQKKADLEVIFIDVGQGDAILIQKGQSQMLIDGGKNGKVIMEKLGSLIPFWDRQIEIVVATHPDADHIGGLVEVLKNYRVNQIIETKAIASSNLYQTWQETVAKEVNEGAEIIEAFAGTRVIFHEDIFAQIFYPFSSLENQKLKSNNVASVVMKLTYGQNQFLLTGDLPQKQEKELVEVYNNLRDNIKIDFNLQAIVLKASHHGSKSSSTEIFLDQVNPQMAVISAGVQNQYGHPHQKVLDRLSERNIKILRTDEMGDIIYRCGDKEESCTLVKY